MKLSNWVLSSLSEKSSQKRYYLIYSLAFAVMAFFCFSWFILTGKALIWFSEDGWYQHYKSLVYYGEYLRQILKNLILEHRLVIPHWDFYIGEGADIINAMHYYVFGDPFALPSVLVPMRFTHLYFSLSCILRLYAAGIAFSALCFETGRQNKRAVLSGALSYCFCYWGLLTAARHPYFLNPMVNFPLMILGIEKIIRKKRPYFFIAAAAISAASNFYFFYMIAVLSVFYALVRLGILYGKNIKQGLMTLLYMGVMALAGLALAGLIFLPVTMMFLGDSRMGMSQPIHWLYPLAYYSQLPAVFISGQGTYWLCLGLVSPAVLSLFLLFRRRKQDLLLKVLAVCGFAVILFPLGGRVLNGMSYMSNRWCWAFVLLVLYIMVREWDDLLSLSRKEWNYLMGVSLAFYGAVLLLDMSRNDKALSVIPTFFMTMIVLNRKGRDGERSWQREVSLMLIIALCIVNNAFWKFAPGAENYSAEFKENNKIWNEKWEDDETGTVRYFAGLDDPENKYPRYSGRSNAVSHNVNMLKRISNTGYYFSISIPSVSAYRRDLQMREDLYYNYKGYDDRTVPMALAGVGYYVTQNGDDKGLPYGYELMGTRNTQYHIQEKYIEELKKELGTEELTKDQENKIRSRAARHIDVYRNLYALPIGYCYDSYITEETWEKLDPVQKQQILLDTALTDREAEGMEKYQEEVPGYRIPCDITCEGQEITIKDETVVTTSEDQELVLTFKEPVKEAEVYVGLEGITFTPVPEYDLYFGSDLADPLQLYNRANFRMREGYDRIRIRKQKLFWNPVRNADFTITAPTGVSKWIDYKQPDASFSSGRNDFIASLGYSEGEISSVTITFSERGIYHFDGINVYSIPMEGYAGKIEKLGENRLENIQFGTDLLEGDISVSSDKILCVATPYSTGWKAYVDGQEQPVMCLNRHYLGLAISPGDHHVRFEYTMPFGREGLLLTLAGLLGTAVIAAITERKQRSVRP